ncbi:hypothetical protein AVEN_86115-1 [Araneus ventricosus]|uniref:DUF4219 domain-containing protein n=1 Tax=Araneus ventricosus TaxID=182803 RepID=A0A4Y2JHB7_ARAVE|nr:hypothetical protein AVEN_86115-1 [Araneus ventricosus]
MDPVGTERFQMLNQSNWNTWKENMRFLLMDRGCWSFVDGSESKLEDNSMRRERSEYNGYARSARVFRIWLLAEQKLIETCNVRFQENKKPANGILNFLRTNKETKEWTEFKVNEPFNSFDYDEDSNNSVRADKTLSSDNSDKSIPITSATNLRSCSSIPFYRDSVLRNN